MAKEEKKVEEKAPKAEPKKDKAKEEKKETKKEEKSKETLLKEELENYKDKYYRTLASLDNQRKQYEKEYSQALRYSSQNLAEKLLPSFEMFSMVIESADNLPSEVSAYVQGFDMVYRQMVQALESEGISEIPCKVGDTFDLNIHSAIETSPVEKEEDVNKITKIVRKGYKIYDRLIRPVTVVVGKLKEEVKEETNKEENKQEA